MICLADALELDDLLHPASLPGRTVPKIKKPRFWRGLASEKWAQKKAVPEGTADF